MKIASLTVFFVNCWILRTQAYTSTCDSNVLKFYYARTFFLATWIERPNPDLTVYSHVVNKILNSTQSTFKILRDCANLPQSGYYFFWTDANNQHYQYWRKDILVVSGDKPGLVESLTESAGMSKWGPTCYASTDITTFPTYKIHINETYFSINMTTPYVQMSLIFVPVKYFDQRLEITQQLLEDDNAEEDNATEVTSTPKLIIVQNPVEKEDLIKIGFNTVYDLRCITFLKLRIAELPVEPEKCEEVNHVPVFYQWPALLLGSVVIFIAVACILLAQDGRQQTPAGDQNAEPDVVRGMRREENGL